MAIEQTKRNRQIYREAIKGRELRYEKIAQRYGITKARVGQIVIAYQKKYVKKA